MHRLLIFLAFFLTASATYAAEPVTLDTIVRAETDTAFRGTADTFGAFGKFAHLRELTPIDKQTVIRMNRDTLYSAVVLDLSKPATVTLPDTNGRYMSMHVINQDHYMYVISKPGTYKLTEKKVGTRYVQLSIRTFVNENDPEDIKAANALQDKIKLEGGGSGSLEIPEWDQEQLKIVRQSFNALASLGLDPGRAFGKKGELDPIHFYVGAISGWGGLPAAAAFYIIASVEKNDGTPYAVTVKDVPVEAFWSITVYNKDGFIEKNDMGAYSFNDVTAKKSEDGSFTINFGDCSDKRANCLPISDGWNYAVRMYKPKKEVLDGSWVFPPLEVGKK